MLHYLFGFHGRINRAKVWLFLLICIVVEIVMVVVAAIGFDWTAFFKAFSDSVHANPGGPVDFAALPSPQTKGVLSIVALAVLALTALALIWAELAIYAKRLHDRAKSAWWLLLYMGAPLALHAFMWCGGKAGAGGPFHHNLTLAGLVAYWLALAIGLWVFIDLWCLKGSTGSNRFGVDPLEKGPVFCDPDKPVYGCAKKPE